ncbi:Imidazolonepropionase [Saliniradius amylolyticus]|uniref:Imidazolonepropionase n=2 Tax=Saliniradius amylolyticus TaxID=2183582 RepID=A0A2S2DZ96_9ALTE|nr:Imidazolonepropionase [Saliniradius amylolyticus]
MRRFLLLLGVVFTPLVSAVPSVITGATVYDGTGAAPLTDATIVVDKGHVRCMGSDCTVPDTANIVDASGKFITPGLVDAHVHYAASGWIDTRQGSLLAQKAYDLSDAQDYLKEHTEKFDHSYLCSGITAVLDTGGFPWTLPLQSSSIKNPNAPRFFGSGPLITHGASPASRFVMTHQKYRGTPEFLPMATDEEARQSVARLAQLGSSAVKVWYQPPADDVVDEFDERLKVVGQEAKRLGLKLIVHAPELREAKSALKAGAEILVHSVEDQLVDEEFLSLAKKNDVVYQPTMGMQKLKALAEMEIYHGLPPDFDDPNGCIDERTRVLVQEGYQTFKSYYQEMSATQFADKLLARGELLQMAQVNAKRVHEAGITVATSTDAGIPVVFHGPAIYTELEMMEEAGIEPKDIIVMSTQNGAKAMGLENELGTLEKGKNADLIILKQDPGHSASAFRTITHVMRYGQLRPVTAFAQVSTTDSAE